MKTGDIIRVVRQGIPIGRYYIVTKLLKGGIIYVRDHIVRKPFRLTAYTPTRTYTKCAVVISREDYDKLNSPIVFKYHHKVSKAWDKIYDEQPDIIEFICRGVKEHIFLETDGIYRKIIDGEPSIRIYFNRRIFQ